MNAELTQGIWYPFRAVLGGEEAPEMALTPSQLEFTQATYAVRFGGEVVDSGTFSVEGGTPFAVLRLHSQAGTHAGRTLPCLVQIQGERMRICFGLDGHLPTAFAAPAQSAHYLVHYRRQRLVS